MSWKTGLARWLMKDLTQDDVLRIIGEDPNKNSPFPDKNAAALLAWITENPVAYVCVVKIAQSFAEPPLIIESFDAVEEKWVPQPESVFLEPFRKNRWISENDIKQYAQLHAQATGKAYLWKWRSRDNVVRELWPLPPQWVTPVLVKELRPGDDQPRVIAGFNVNPNDGNGGEPMFIDASEMVYTKFAHPSNLWDGLSPMHAASRHLFLDDKGTDYKGESVTSLATPGIVVKTRKQMTPSQKADLRAALQRKTGVDPRANAFLISGDDASIDFINPLKDFNWESYNDADESRICACFQVPPVVAGLLVGLKNSPWSNTGEAKRWFYTNTLSNLWEMWARSYTRSLIPLELQATTRFRFDLTDVPELRDDADAIAERAGKLFDRGIITRARAKEMIGESVDPDDAVYKYGAATLLLPEGAGSDMGLDIEPMDQDEQLTTEQDLIDGELSE